jgi:hypothetical protein
MSNEKMRLALKARDRAQEERPTTANTVADGEVPAKVKRTAKKAADAAARAGKGGEMSVRDYIADATKGGKKLKISDALDFAKRTGRSKVTVYRMIRENKHHVVDGMVVRDK